jgi:diguanylate cyclase (GGDEF)-like protein
MNSVSLEAAAAPMPERAERRRGYRRQMIGLIAGSYLLDAAILFAYYASGTTPLSVPVGYAICGLAASAFFLILSETGLSERSNDHYLTIWMIAAAAGIQFGFLTYAPEVGFVFLVTLFIIFGFGSLRLTTQQAAITWAIAMLGLALFLLGTDLVPMIPAKTRFERVILMFVVGLSLGRCVFLGLYGSMLRETLHGKNAQLSKALSRIEDFAWLDDLTGTLNRRRLMKELSDEMAKAERSGRPLSVAILDLDWFKTVNDRFGHLVGDEVLKKLPETISGVLRSTDMLGRYGGEEFMLILPGATEQEALAIVNRVCKATAGSEWNGISRGLALTVSVGVSTYHSGETIETLIGRADRALYQAKTEGRNRALAA